VPEFAVSFLIAAAVAAVIAGPLLRSLAEGGFTVTNYRGVPLPCPLGLLVPAALCVAFVPLCGAVLLGADPEVLALSGFVFPVLVSVLGLADDAFSSSSRGLRGHLSAVLRGEFSTGALKAVGIAGLALGTTYGAYGDDDLRWLLTALVLMLATNLFNLVDLRPGRAVKAYVLVAAACALLAWDEALFQGMATLSAVVLVAGVFDLREQGMLGDTGSNAIGAAAGVWLVGTIDTSGGLAVCAAVLLALTAYGEFRSISAFIERTPGFRHLDSLGRVHRA